jgi:DNA invertase Pin-like site-specific DNA recombinase
MPKPSKRSRTATEALRVIGYTRVSTEDQAESGAGLAAQKTAIETAVQRAGWELLELIVDPALSGASMKKRPQLIAALDRLDAGEADVLLVSKLDRLSRSVRDFATTLERAQDKGWRLVLLDLGDTSTPVGEMTANVIASAAQYERRLIGQRTREGLAAKRAAGVRLGRPSRQPRSVVLRIVAERSTGARLRVIADGLTRDGIPTTKILWMRSRVAEAVANGESCATPPPGSGRWSTSSVQAVLAGQDARREMSPGAKSN